MEERIQENKSFKTTIDGVEYKCKVERINSGIDRYKYYAYINMSILIRSRFLFINDDYWRSYHEFAKEEKTQYVNIADGIAFYDINFVKDLAKSCLINKRDTDAKEKKEKEKLAGFKHIDVI